MNSKDAEEYTQSLGQLVSGSWRQIALAKKLGVPKLLGLSVDQWVNDRLGGYVRYSIAERRAAVQELTANGLSGRAIGEVLGVDEGTVRGDKGAEFSATEGKFLSEKDAEHEEGAEFSAPVDALAALAVEEVAPAPVRGTAGTKAEEWYTPELYLTMARRVLGTIDLDPASSELAQRTVRAAKFFTAADDGLAEPWDGKVWLNPPYTQPAIALFMKKLRNEYGFGNIEAAIALTHNYTDTEWFQETAELATSICFPRGRIRFINPKGELASPTQGQAFFYFGSQSKLFYEIFGRLGFVR